MRTLSPARLANTLTAHDRKRLMEHGHEANFLEGTRLRLLDEYALHGGVDTV
ncbi:hypothetical protein OH828_20615 [Streptomyces anulatus]|uniref:hypothetical protein n=1 Tax=Streptomyces anulatus TaxID=1892 RepID=UPI003862E4E0